MAERMTIKELEELADELRQVADKMAADMTEQSEIILRNSGSRIAGVQMGDLDREDRLLLMSFIGWSAPMVVGGDMSSEVAATVARAFLIGLMCKRALK